MFRRRIRTDDDLFEILLKIYQEMYKKATPPGNFKKMMKTKETFVDGFWKKYYLSQEEQEKIYKKYEKKYKLNTYEKNKLYFNVCLGCSPISCKENQEEK